eukprot:CAMPEP_0194072350 /NCGR_PEP_ID=MMETSP0149-20130528/119_1 /TAXON_ID=122233 /ORGANISM="Chaetoceros debilis, Strain MM31A-1" /LENGTH=92 /DNA_ID=CAMNT_0038752227 /DNA_START=292 /DNA_END=567 /DNA_ORIENTATION=-
MAGLRVTVAGADLAAQQEPESANNSSSDTGSQGDNSGGGNDNPGTLQLVLVNMCCYSMPHTPTAHEEATNSGHAMQGIQTWKQWPIDPFNNS